MPVVLEEAVRQRPSRFEAYDAPLPFVAEIWSPSTGRYDIDSKLPDDKERGDAKIWRRQRFAKRLTRWLRQPDGRHPAETPRGDNVPLHALPGAVIDLDALVVDE